MSTLSQRHLDSVVAIERADGVDEEGRQKYAPLGSGVLVGRPVPPEDLEKEPAEGVESLYLYLVTNWHVIEGHEEIFAKINAGGTAQRFALGFEGKDGSPYWFSHGSFDIAVTYIKAKILHAEDAEFIAIPEKYWLTLEQMDQESVGLGDFVLVCGFPMGLSGTLKKFAIVRNGAIARLDEEILAEDNSYLLDCSVFPGNSGGPVFDRPDAASGLPPRLIGIASGYLPYQDIAISVQTGNPRVTFEENSGLAAVVPVDAIIGACDACYAAGDSRDDSDGSGDGRKEHNQAGARLVPGPVDS
jgi:S1-C subfamily serine protease